MNKNNGPGFMKLYFSYLRLTKKSLRPREYDEAKVLNKKCVTFDDKFHQN